MAPVVVQPYNPEWPSQFETIREGLLTVLQGVEFIAVEHVGSTSVPNLAAKATIDLDIVVTPEHLQDTITALVEKGGYKYLGELGILDRHAFRAEHLLPLRNLYVCIEGSESLRNHIALRDLLRQEGQLREEYGAFKLKLAAQNMEIDPYCVHKTPMILKILDKAGFGEDSRKRIAVSNQHFE